MLTKIQLKKLCSLLAKHEHALESNLIGAVQSCRFVVNLGDGDGYLPFEVGDAEKVETTMGEILCVIPDVVPYALPFSLAVQVIPNHIWKTAVQTDKTLLGFNEYKAQYARQHALMSFLQEKRA